MIYEKIVNRRTIRRFQQRKISEEILIKCVDAARLSPSASNLQRLKFLIVNEENLLSLVFNTLPIWAGHLKYKPSIEEMPRAYIIILLDTDISTNPGHDAGIAAMSISLVAHDEGIGSCIFGLWKKKLEEILKVPKNLKIMLVIALGYPSEQPIMEIAKNGRIKFWLDKNRILHVPKRNLEEILAWNRYRDDRIIRKK